MQSAKPEAISTNPFDLYDVKSETKILTKQSSVGSDGTPKKENDARPAPPPRGNNTVLSPKAIIENFRNMENPKSTQAKKTVLKQPSNPRCFDYGEQAGMARDLIAVVSLDKTTAYFLAPAVRFTRGTSGGRVQVYINGKQRFDMPMDGNGNILSKEHFLDLFKLSPEIRDACLDGASPTSCYHVRFEHNDKKNIYYCESILFLISASDYVVISDVDGTITKSDVFGHINTTVLQKAGMKPNNYAHAGVCVLFNELLNRDYVHGEKKHGLHFVYLTARPLNLINNTKEYLRTVEQEGLELPLGAVVTDRTTYSESLKTEVINKTSHIFKSEYLTDLYRLFFLSGRNVEENPPFILGFGNKDTDAISYEAVHIPKDLIFIVDSKSLVRATKGFENAVPNYDDPSLRKYVDETIEQFLQCKIR